MIPEIYEQYVVEFSVAIVDPRYTELLSDPAAPQYQDITQDLTDKVGTSSAHRQEMVGCLLPQDIGNFIMPHNIMSHNYLHSQLLLYYNVSCTVN